MVHLPATRCRGHNSHLFSLPLHEAPLFIFFTLRCDYGQENSLLCLGEVKLIWSRDFSNSTSEFSKPRLEKLHWLGTTAYLLLPQRSAISSAQFMCNDLRLFRDCQYRIKKENISKFYNSLLSIRRLSSTIRDIFRG